MTNASSQYHIRFMSLKVIHGGRESKICSCGVCDKKFKSHEQGHASTFVWMTIGESSGFQTDTFNICGTCSAHLLIELKAYIESRVGIKRK